MLNLGPKTRVSPARLKYDAVQFTCPLLCCIGRTALTIQSETKGWKQFHDMTERIEEETKSGVREGGGWWRLGEHKKMYKRWDRTR